MKYHLDFFYKRLKKWINREFAITSRRMIILKLFFSCSDISVNKKIETELLSQRKKISWKKFFFTYMFAMIVGTFIILCDISNTFKFKVIISIKFLLLFLNHVWYRKKCFWVWFWKWRFWSFYTFWGTLHPRILDLAAGLCLSVWLF